MNVVKHFQSLCTPARVYLAVNLFFIILTLLTKMNIMKSLACVLFVILIAMLLDFLCKKGLKSLSWLFVIVFTILPLVFAIMDMDMRMMYRM